MIEILYFALVRTPRTVLLRPISTRSQHVGDFISTLMIPNLLNEYTSEDNISVYHPNYSSHSGGNTAIVFTNLEAAIPCYQADPIGPACHMFAFEEDNSSMEGHSSKHLIMAVISVSLATSMT